MTTGNALYKKVLAAVLLAAGAVGAADVRVDAPQPEVFSVANVRTLALTNVTVTGVSAPLVRTWDGRPELKLENVAGAKEEIAEGAGRYTCTMR